MIRKTILTAAAAAIISATALGSTASSAAAGVKVFFGHGWGPAYGYDSGWDGGYHNPCRHWKRKYNNTGRHRYLRKYRRCMNAY